MWPYTPDQETMMTSRRPATGSKRTKRLQRASVVEGPKPMAAAPRNGQNNGGFRRQTTGTGNFRRPLTS